MAHAFALIADLETEVVRNESVWRESEEYHLELYKRYLRIQSVLYSSSRRFNAVPAFHTLRDFSQARSNHVASSNEACGSGSGGTKRAGSPRPNDSETKRSRSDSSGEQYTSETLQLRPGGYRHVKLFGFTSRQFDMQLRNLNNVSDIEEHVETCFNEALDHFRTLSDVAPHDQVGVEIDYPGLRENEPVLVHFQPINTLDGWVIMRAITRVLQSYQTINIAEPATITFTHLRTPTGGGPPNKTCLKFMTEPDMARAYYNKGHGHLLAMKKGDQLCLPKCILIAQAKQNKKLYTSRKGARMNLGGQLVEEARALLRLAGIAHDGPCSLYDVGRIQEIVPERILIFDRERAHACIWDGRRNAATLDNRVRITLQLDQGHFDIISSMPAFFGSRNFCFDCMKTFSHLHKCGAQCSYCRARSVSNCEPDGTTTTCTKCNRWFTSLQCFSNHKLVLSEKKPACDIIKNCRDCGHRVTVKKHVCGTHYCATCQKSVKTLNHVCYIQKHAPKKPKKGAIGKEIFCDFESCFVTGGDRLMHKPIFACAQVQCAQCSSSWDRAITCQHCKEPPEQIFSGANTIDEFCRWLFADNHKHAVAVFHNFKGYDGQFITEWASTVPSIQFTMKPRGLSILNLECNYVRIICSMNYLSVALRKLPAMFRFQDEVIKGEFPYRLLTDIDRLTNDAIPWPSIDLYDPDRRSASDRTTLIAWYETVKDQPFHTLDQVTEYCKSDVTILRRAMSMFRDMFKKVSGIHPFESAFTIASACMQSFTMNNMPTHALTIHKESGPRRTSKKCVMWLLLREHDDKVRIRSSRTTGGEYRLVCGVRNFAADGVVQDNDGKVIRIYEFYGCYFHACPVCYKFCDEASWMGGDKTFRDKYNDTTERMEIIKLFYPNVEVVEMWEHDYDELVKEPRVAHLNVSMEARNPIDPRAALKGGRVEVCQLNGASDDPDYAAAYIDVVSMYPSVQMREAFPIGNHKVILNATIDMMRKPDGEYHVPWFGLMHVKLLATRRLFHSPVPFNTPSPDKKLVFPLCATCAITQSNTCAHTAEEMSWWTTLSTVEVALAFKHGFIPVGVGEIWDYENKMQFDPDIPDSGLFSEYIASWLCKKVEATGYPPLCKTDEEKSAFISDYKTNQNVTLDPDNMEPNPPMRATAKLALNNLWGKLCQRNNQTQYSYFKRTQLADYYRLTLDPNQTKSAVIPMNDQCMCVIHKTNEETGTPSKSQSIVIGVFVTSYARKKLFETMHELGSSVVYTDTDSIIYVKHPDGYDPPLSSFLGGWESELAPDEYINRFVMCSPKSYSLRVKGPSGVRYITKAKGFTLDYMTSLVLHHDKMHALVEKYVATGERETVVMWRHAILKNKQRQVYSEHLSRKFRVVNTKRTFNNSPHCRPFGFDNPSLV